ncbi:MAG: ubiquinol-cytochrome C chaperone [Rhodobacteraceae bacterium]|nr:ubiquinol-cytochrome C chaperone [Paracoccaceae bacterium]
MPFGLFRRKSRDAEHRVYSQIVAQARQPVFYQGYFVPDTIDARFDMIVVHTVLLFRRFKGAERSAGTFAQNVFDLFFADMDANLREIGIADVRVPKKIGKMAEAFYGRADAYIPLIDANDEKALAQALERNIWPEDETAETSTATQSEPLALARYMIGAAAALEAQDTRTICEGSVNFPDGADYLGQDR